MMKFDVHNPLPFFPKVPIKCFLNFQTLGLGGVPFPLAPFLPSHSEDRITRRRLETNIF